MILVKITTIFTILNKKRGETQNNRGEFIWIGNLKYLNYMNR